MLALAHYVILVSAAVPVALSATDSLTIKTVFKPDDCMTFAKAGDTVAVHYTGKLDSGKIFDSSVEAQRDPIEFVLGSGKVIPGWENGIVGMCVGEKRKLDIPPELAYGQQTHAGIPGNSWLYFDVELMSLKGASFSFDIEFVLSSVQFWALPALVLYVLYYIYNRYQQQQNDLTSQKVAAKQARKSKRR